MVVLSRDDIRKWMSLQLVGIMSAKVKGVKKTLKENYSMIVIYASLDRYLYFSPFLNNISAKNASKVKNRIYHRFRMSPHSSTKWEINIQSSRTILPALRSLISSCRVKVFWCDFHRSNLWTVNRSEMNNITNDLSENNMVDACTCSELFQTNIASWNAHRNSAEIFPTDENIL